MEKYGKFGEMYICTINSCKKKMEQKFPEFSCFGGRALSFGIFFCLDRVFKRIEMANLCVQNLLGFGDKILQFATSKVSSLHLRRV